MQVAPDCQEKLPNGSVSQLEARLQRLPVHVRHAVGKDAPVNERHLVYGRGKTQCDSIEFSNGFV